MKSDIIKIWDDRDDVKLSTYLAEASPFDPNPPKRPAIIVLPGGGYQTCMKQSAEGEPVALSFAADGYQSFVLEYSVATSAPKGKALFPAQVIDLGKAILTIKEHADEWLIDTDKITICGFSAGAHLCSMYATHWHTDMLAGALGCDASEFKVMAAICMYAIHDYKLQLDYNIDHENFMSDTRVNLPIFGTKDPTDEQLKQFSPIHHVTENMPPMFMVAATDDALVPATQTINMAQRLQEVGVPYECHLFQYGDHAFGLGKNMITPFKKELDHTCARWVSLSKIFLMHLISPETLKPEEFTFSKMFG